MSREKGFYWIKCGGPKWEPAEWVGDCFILIGLDIPYDDSELDEVGDKIEVTNGDICKSVQQ